MMLQVNRAQKLSQYRPCFLNALFEGPLLILDQVGTLLLDHRNLRHDLGNRCDLDRLKCLQLSLGNDQALLDSLRDSHDGNCIHQPLDVGG
jgi:hypothetical protein